MTIEQFAVLAIVVVLLIEVTYLVVKLPRQSNTKKRMIFVDTSVLIDGRIIPVAQSGFVGDTLVIPRSVVGELQFLADNADAEKRSRARHGLDVVKDLQEMAGIDVMILQDGSKAEEGVDNRLLKLAKKYGGVVCTIDYNLNKVAAVEGITVLNVNELAQSLRMAYLPGEKILLELVQKGQDSHQAVGYLPDGTMVVVEHAYKQIGKTVEVEFIRSLQTAAGKMMFAKRTELKDKPAAQPVQAAAKPAVQQVIDRADRPRKRVNGRASAATEQPAQPKPAQQQPAKRQNGANNSRRQRPADREANLINLVQRQQ